MLAIAMLSIPAFAQGMGGSGSIDIFGKNGVIFQTEGSAYLFPEFQDTNADTMVIGNDRAMAFGVPWHRAPVTLATNNLEVIKNQDTGDCNCCDGRSICQDCCIKVNIDQIKIGNRDALAFGFASATNNVKVIANQQ
ncbi:hypothetical protein [Methanothrix soehngenii]|uniref:hypothetical protein n=1 Tax=Methanothrix soehngenii TaxID=2223 RepID=UPI00300D89E0